MRGSAPSSPTSAGFMPRPRLSTITMPPMAAASRLFTNAPMPYAILRGKEIRSAVAVGNCVVKPVFPESDARMPRRAIASCASARTRSDAHWPRS
jgi:hypothetical protein